MKIGNHEIGRGHPAFIIAEMSANHGHDYERAVDMVHAMKESGADAVKLQTYTPDTMTLNEDGKWFQVGKGTLWEGENLYSLYGKAYTPWEWQPKLKALVEELGMFFFSTPFEETSLEFLSDMDVQAYKIASFENNDVEFIKKVAAKGKPIILSTGMATLSEIEAAVQAMRDGGCPSMALLKCTSAYPAPPEAINLHTISHLSQAFNVPTGLSDHTMGSAVAVAAVALGATIIEKHFTLSRGIEGPDSAFSMEPAEFKAMVEAIRMTEKAVGGVQYTITEKEKASMVFRRSLFIVKDVKAGEPLTEEHVRSIRPGYGLAPKFLPLVLGAIPRTDLQRGTPLEWEHLLGGPQGG